MAFLDTAGVQRLWSHINLKLNNKVDKTDGMGLSTNDYTTEEKNMLHNLNTLVGDTPVAEQIAQSIPYATDEEILAAMIDAGIIPAVLTETGALLSSDENTVLML